MRDEPSVSAASRAAVMAAAEALGYRANAVARSLVQRRTYNVGVMVSDLHNIFSPRSWMDSMRPPPSAATGR